jgi:hypothetical protein
MWCCPRKLKTRSFVHVFLCVIASLFLDGKICGTSKDICLESDYKLSKEVKSKITAMVSVCLMIFTGSSVCCTIRMLHHCDIDASATNRLGSIELSQTSVVSVSLPITSQRPEIQSVNTDTLLRDSTERRLPEYNNCNPRRESTTSIERQNSTSPPTYDDFMRGSSTIITMEQQSSLPPPTYDDFMREN